MTKTLNDGYIYDSNEITLLFDLEEKPSDSKRVTTEGNLVTTGLTWTTTFVTGSTSNVVGGVNDPRIKNTKWIGRTKKSKFVIVNVDSVKDIEGQDRKIELRIIRYFKDAKEIVDYLAPRYG